MPEEDFFLAALGVTPMALYMLSMLFSTKLHPQILSVVPTM
jgi:hypothetical protein